MEPKVIYEDKSLLILDKPAGWIVNEARTTKGQKVVQKWLSNMPYSLVNNREMRSGIVHRIDKETSGILVVAKSADAFENLQKQFKLRQVEKKYTALVHGKVQPKKGSVDAPIGRLPWNRERFGVLPGGKAARSEYIVESYYTLDLSLYTILSVYPKTGRTHQIRVHCKYLGYPIVSDEFYAGRKTARADRLWCPRLFLHASYIKFTHPMTGKIISIECELEADLKTALKVLTPS